MSNNLAKYTTRTGSTPLRSPLHRPQHITAAVRVLPQPQQRCSQELQQPQPQLQVQPQQKLKCHQRQQMQQTFDRRGLLAALTVVAATTASSAPARAAAPAAAATSAGARPLEEYMKMEDAGKLKDQRALDNIRGKYGIRRSLDGRVQLRRRSGVWVSVRLDMEVPGAILLRDNKTGAVYALETDSLPQVDLSDDYVLFMMFADGSWEDDMTPIEFEGDNGSASQLTMNEKEFHEFVGILKDPEEEPRSGGSARK